MCLMGWSGTYSMPSCYTQIIKSKQVNMIDDVTIIFAKNSIHPGGTSTSIISMGPSRSPTSASKSETSLTTSIGYSIIIVCFGKKRPVMAGTTYIHMITGESIVNILFNWPTPLSPAPSASTLRSGACTLFDIINFSISISRICD